MAKPLSPWYKRNPDELLRIEQDLLGEFPSLQVLIESSTAFVRGTFPLRFQHEVLDTYQIEIEFPDNYSHDLPVAREVGGRIPRTDDHHIDNQKGDICLFVPDERWRIFPENAPFLDFLRIPVYNYFLSESLVEVGEDRPFGERAHGAQGIIEYYEEELGTSDENSIVRCVDMLSRGPARGHWPCYCGSGKKLRNCHLTLIRDLQDRIPATVARQSLVRLRANLNRRQPIVNRTY